MNDKILKFIKNEKEIAEYRLSLLRASKSTAYKDRLTAKEEAYIAFPFEEIDLSSIEEARDALMLFKIDRPSFNYKFSIQADNNSVALSQINNLYKKIYYLRDVHKKLLNIEILSNNIDKYAEYLAKKNNGAIFEKAKARIKIMICCLSRHMLVETKSFESKISKEMSKSSFMNLKNGVDSLYDDALNHIFKFYNDSIEQAYALTRSVDNNEFMLSIYPIVDIFDKFSDDQLSLKRLLKDGEGFFSKTGRPISKKSAQRGWGVVTPMNRVGNETTEILYRTLYSDRKVCLDAIIERSFFNLKDDDGLYKKAISTVPAWKIISTHLNEDLELEVCRLFGVERDSIHIADSLSKETIRSINLSNNSIKIDADKSKILIAATRSEAEKISEAKKYIELLIKELKEEYNNQFFVKQPSGNDQESRVNKIKGIIGSITK